MQCIAYKSGYKYQLQDDYVMRIDITPHQDISTSFITLSKDGNLTIRKGYAWDGPSGPTIDARTFMRGSLVHDALYQLMRENYIDEDSHRDTADRWLRKICCEDGMSFIRAWLVYQGFRWFGRTSADPAHDKPVIHAPKGC